ncbi:MAG: hypothetical protein JRG90_18405 [Deltaproteobacteria bacterium]|nr:hypothetical protein [Deltaproteobacteria bacterium]
MRARGRVKQQPKITVSVRGLEFPMSNFVADFRPNGRLLSLLIAAFVVCLAGAASAEDDRPKEMPYDTPGEFPQLSPDYSMTSHKVVLVTDNGLNPRLATLDEGQLVAWISYSQQPSIVVFEREVARSMICHSLVNFSIEEDELRSAPINAGEFASFCQLKPGRYKYKILRKGLVQSGSDAARMLEGEIIVGNPNDS